MNDEATPQKRCSKCGETKPLAAFNKHKRKKDGLNPHCKACRAEYRAANAEAHSEYRRAYYAANLESAREKDRARYAANAEKLREKDRARYAANAEKLREQARTRYAANPEAMREKDRAYCAANPDVIRKKNRASYTANAEKRREYSRTYRATNGEIIREKDRAYRAANLEVAREKDRAYRAANAEVIRKNSRAYYAANYAVNPDLYRAINQRRRARIKGNGGTFTREELTLKRLTQGGFCAYCQSQHDPNALTIDHIIPLKQGGRHEAANICLACRRCNSSKGNRTPKQWTNRWYWQQREDDE